MATALRVLAATGGGWLIGGQLGALFGFLGAVVASLSPSLAGAYVVAAAVLTGAATLFEARFGGLFASARFVRERPLAGDIGRLTGVLLLAWLIAARPRERTSIDGEDASADDDENDGPATAGRIGDDSGPENAGLEDAGALATARTGIRRLRGRTDDTSGQGHLVSGSAWVMMGFLAQAVTGVGFWVLAARVYSQVDVGVASGLFTSLQFINYATALGLQELLSRYRPETRGDPLLGWSTLATMASSLAGTAIYLGLVGRGGGNSALSALTGAGAPAILGFVGVAAANAIAALADARMMWARKWSWVFWRLALAGAVRLPLVLLPAAATAETTDGSVGVWLFFVMAAPIALSGLVSLYLLRRAGNPPLSLDRPETGWNGPLRYAGVNYLSHLAILAPQFILPVIVFVNVRAVTYANFFGVVHRGGGIHPASDHRTGFSGRGKPHDRRCGCHPTGRRVGGRLHARGHGGGRRVGPAAAGHLWGRLHRGGPDPSVARGRGDPLVGHLDSAGEGQGARRLAIDRGHDRLCSGVRAGPGHVAGSATRPGRCHRRVGFGQCRSLGRRRRVGIDPQR